MRRNSLSRAFLVSLAAAALLSACSSSGGNTSSSGSSASESSASKSALSRGSGPASDLAAVASGTYRLQEGGDLQIRISGVGGSGQRLDLFTSARGSIGGRNVTEQGVLRLESEGPDVLATYTPHFDPGVTELSQNVTEFSQTETQSACSLVLRRDADGWEGNTEERGTCVRAIGGAVGRWRVEILQDQIRFTGPGNGQALVFRKG